MESKKWNDIQAENTLRGIPRSKPMAAQNHLSTCMTSEPAGRESFTEHGTS